MKRKKTFRHLTQSDRDRLEILLREGHSQVEIAQVLKVNKSTISREIKKRKQNNGIYDSDTAQHKARVRRSNSKYRGMRVEANQELKQYIIDNLQSHRSPDEISGRMKQEGQPFYAGKKAIYKWLYSSYGDGYCKYLCTKRHKVKRQKKTEKRQTIPNKISIIKRPRHRWMQHAEGDLFVSPRSAETPASVAIVCLPKSQYLVAEKMINRKPSTMAEAVNKVEKQVKMHTLTLDRGIENRYHEQFKTRTYFCDAHSPWQKPHVENNIGLLRRWFIPKKTDLAKLENTELQKYISILNNKYRKSLGYRSAYEVAMESGILKEGKP